MSMVVLQLDSYGNLFPFGIRKVPIHYKGKMIIHHFRFARGVFPGSLFVLAKSAMEFAYRIFNVASRT